MSVFFQFAILGACVGALYALAALGLVIVYRGSGVINFAHGAVGVVGAYTYYELHEKHNWSFTPAFVLSLALCALIGALIQVAVMRPLRGSSPLSRILGTLGVLALIQGLLSQRYKQESLVITSSLPLRRVSFGGINIGLDRLLILLIVIVISLVLAFVYARTSFGRATAAVAENELSASYLGYSPGLIAAANWAVGSALAGTAAILLAPITGLQTAQLTLLLVPALAAAVVGNMTSFPITLVAGLTIGTAETLAGRYIHSANWGSAAPFLLTLIVMSIRGRVLPDRSHLRLRLPTVGSGRVRPALLVPAVVVAVVLLQVIPLAWVDGATTTLAVAVIALSVVVVTGYGGQISLAQIVIAGFGAWVAGRLVATTGIGFGPALVIGVLAALPPGIIVGLPALRTRGATLGVITLAFGVAVEALLFNSGSLTGGDVGTQVGFTKLFGIDLDTVLHPRNYALFELIIFVLCGLVVANLRRGRAGRRLLAVRANERAAAAAGVNTTVVKLYAFSLGAMIAALGGILMTFRNTSIVYSNIHAFDSVSVLGYAVIGGVGYVFGPIVGGVLQPGGLGTNIGNLFGSSVQTYLPAIGGGLLILTLIFAQNGTVHLEARRWGPLLDRAGALVGRAARRSPRRARTLTPRLDPAGGGARSAPTRRVPGATLRTESLSVTFGSTKALVDLSLEVRPGEVVGLIGPNGAGKTTAIDAITGFVRNSAGRVYLGDKDLTRRSARQRAEARLARSFQSLELFEDLTVAENLLVFTEAQAWRHYLTDLIWPRRPRFSPTALDAIELFELADDLDRMPTELSYGRRRLVAIARAIAAEPAVLLLDEPAAGLSQTESAELRTLLRHLADDRGMGVLLVEHDVDLVMSSCDRVVALVFGRQVASGTPAEVRQDPHVVQAYLGVDSDEADGDDGDAADGGGSDPGGTASSPLAVAGVPAGAVDNSRKESQP